MDETDRLLVALDLNAVRNENRRRESREYRESLALLRALRLSPSLEVCEAILENPRSVPTSKLDPDWRKAYGIK